MNELQLAIFTLVGLSLSFPFLIISIINPDGFGNHEQLPLISLGLSMLGLPISVIGMYKILKHPLFNDDIKDQKS